MSTAIIITTYTGTMVRTLFRQNHAGREFTYVFMKGLHVLTQHIASGAMFDSSARYPPGKCHPGTREKALKIITDWIIDPAPEHSVIWLYGPAGSGKSAIAQSIAELLWQLYQSQYGGSFFFAAGDIEGRGNGDKLFSTLAYQLAVQFPSLLPFINDTLSKDPMLPTRSMEIQIKALIVDPLLQVSNWVAHTPTIIVDGLDECADSTTQRNILSLISYHIRHHSLPLRFLIASRPEYWIRDTFEVGTMHDLTLPISLNEVGDAHGDIERYLVAEFAEICNKYSRIMSSVVKPWPPTRIVERFVEEASGQFIYASTIVKFVGYSSDFCDPREQLRILTTADPHRATAFSTLDALYASILSRIPDTHRAALKLVIGGIILDLSVQTIEIFLGVDAGVISIILDALNSLIDVRPVEFEAEEVLEVFYGPRGCPEETRITFYHLSFQEFLENEPRSGKYFVDVAAISHQLWFTIANLIGDALEQKPEFEQHKA
ncbi:hypothetical protein CVT25_003723 [Psilocybe cyanescens]|uniref:Nephrocystin 3-like N-terminal domain-containing protein n=1 Tax=Psilocybe cyanescens TaxID=93625 RepID=A0A409XIT4_PSICY|nr:hypothetical protein CVT25_003723 [Psilocybe cyanescens]